jgi:hypothetical protein
MAKTGGLGDNFYIAGFNASGDIGQLGAIGGGPAALVVTGIDKSGFERIGGLRDGRIEYNAFFNQRSVQLGGIHDKLAALPTSDQSHHLRPRHVPRRRRRRACTASRRTTTPAAATTAA